MADMSMRLDLWISMANYQHWLVVYLTGPTPLKNMKVSWDDEIPNIWTIKKCSKPPTRPIYLGSLRHLWAESKPTEA